MLTAVTQLRQLGSGLSLGPFLGLGRPYGPSGRSRCEPRQSWPLYVPVVFVKTPPLRVGHAHPTNFGRRGLPRVAWLTCTTASVFMRHRRASKVFAGNVVPFKTCISHTSTWFSSSK